MVYCIEERLFVDTIVIDTLHYLKNLKLDFLGKQVDRLPNADDKRSLKERLAEITSNPLFKGFIH